MRRMNMVWRYIFQESVTSYIKIPAVVRFALQLTTRRTAVRFRDQAYIKLYSLKLSSQLNFLTGDII